MRFELLIIGAGLSGLRAAMRAEALGLDYRVLEARGRVGGRAFGVDVGAGAGLDLGPTWVWPAYQPRIEALIEELGLRTFGQHETGALPYETAAGVQSLDYPRRYAAAARLAGGPSALARAMAARLPADRVVLDAEVTGLAFADCVSARLADGRVIEADRVIAAAPPPLVADWAVTPELPAALVSALRRWPTWMAAHAKVFARYDAPFWRATGRSGSAISQVGPLMEIVDHSDEDAGVHALFGFFGWSAVARRQRADGLKRETLAQLERLFGPDAARPIDLRIKDWAADRFTATTADATAPRGHPPYGEAELRQLWFDGRLAFAGAEAAPEHGGLIEGALLAADRAVKAVSATIAATRI